MPADSVPLPIRP